LIGAIDRVKQGHTPLFVGHAGEGAVSASKEVCFDGLREGLKPPDLDRLRLKSASSFSRAAI
jgi:hypothetical protein